jgi:hypothetical protein
MKATEEEVLVYLNELRDSGATNMFGAAPYVQTAFDTDKQEARRLVSLWMENYNEDGDYSTFTNEIKTL